jgi:hypothetical protein
LTRRAQDIADLFNCLHDGDIRAFTLLGQTLRLTVEIEYLAERILPGSDSVFVELEGVLGLRFVTWQRSTGGIPSVSMDASAALAGQLEILDAKARDGEVSVNLYQHDQTLNYAGGQLICSAKDVRLEDEAGGALTLAELKAAAEGYWADWASQTDK